MIQSKSKDKKLNIALITQPIEAKY